MNDEEIDRTRDYMKRTVTYCDDRLKTLSAYSPDVQLLQTRRKRALAWLERNAAR